MPAGERVDHEDATTMIDAEKSLKSRPCGKGCQWLDSNLQIPPLTRKGTYRDMKAQVGWDLATRALMLAAWRPAMRKAR
jgi:hypothetical protein